MKQAIGFFSGKPRTLFLLDSAGACATAVLLFAVLRKNEEQFGMPAPQLEMLSLVALLFSIYSLLCFAMLKARFGKFLRFIALANLAYCGCTIGLMAKHRDTLTALGFAYFFGEVIIIFGLSYLELAVSKRVSS